MEKSNHSVLLTAHSVSKSFGERLVLQDISLSVNQGQRVTLIGPNGAGKTTLVRIILGLLQPDSGTISRDQSLQVGYMPQRLHIEPTLPLTVFRFLQFANKHDGKLIEKTLDDLNILHLLRHQMVSISMAIQLQILLL